jgi:hypothetical protein
MLYLPGGGAMLFLTDVDHVSFEKANETRQNNLQSATVSLQVVIGLCKRKETAALKIKAAVSNGRQIVCSTTAFFLLPSSGRKSLFVSILRNQSYFQMTSILLICKINKKVAHTDLLGGTTSQIHMSI